MKRRHVRSSAVLYAFFDTPFPSELPAPPPAPAKESYESYSSQSDSHSSSTDSSKYGTVSTGVRLLPPPCDNDIMIPATTPSRCPRYPNVASNSDADGINKHAAAGISRPYTTSPTLRERGHTVSAKTPPSGVVTSWNKLSCRFWRPSKLSPPPTARQLCRGRYGPCSLPGRK